MVIINNSCSDDFQRNTILILWKIINEILIQRVTLELFQFNLLIQKNQLAIKQTNK